MLTLGVESSCDETSAAIIRDGRHILANIIHSQIPIHARYGGVVPELASRNHVMSVLPVIREALDAAEVGQSDIDLFAVTIGPGLVGSLMVGLETAKAIAYRHNRPLIGVNHLEGHILAPLIDADCRERVVFPYVALVVSGGHTSLYLVRDVGSYELLGGTLDDAAGEAFDKVAKRLGGPYPGGPYIERNAVGGDSRGFNIPRPMIGRPGFSFSFSGLKTAAATQIERLEASAQPGREKQPWLADMCASVQEAIVQVLVRKTLKAALECNVSCLVLGGGVACNGALRDRFRRESQKRGIVFVVPKPRLCSDNAAMIACVGALRHAHAPSRGFDQFSLDVSSSLPLLRLR